MKYIFSGIFTRVSHLTDILMCSHSQSREITFHPLLFISRRLDDRSCTFITCCTDAFVFTAVFSINKTRRDDKTRRDTRKKRESQCWFRCFSGHDAGLQDFKSGKGKQKVLTERLQRREKSLLNISFFGFRTELKRRTEHNTKIRRFLSFSV